MRRLTATLLCTLAACTTVDRPALTFFEPGPGATFRYSAKTDILTYRIDSPDAEAIRMQWLETYLSDNKLCPAGYEITSRRPVVIADSLTKLYNIFYDGRCK